MRNIPLDRFTNWVRAAKWSDPAIIRDFFVTAADRRATHRLSGFDLQVAIPRNGSGYPKREIKYVTARGIFENT